jgi:hypothetical protein
MTYLELINRFWKMHKEVFFTAHETQLYFKLLDTCNSLGWKNPFMQSNRYICGEIGVSEPKLIELRNKLKQIGLVDFISGKKKRELTQYFLLGLTELSLNGSLTDSLNGSLTDSLNSQKPLDNIRDRRDKDIDKKKEGKPSISPVGDAPMVKPSFIIDEYNRICINLRPVKLLTEKRSQMIAARVRQYGIDKVIQVLENASKSNFLAGQNQRSWTADLDWIMLPTNFVKVLEGKYNNKTCVENGNNNRSRDPKVAVEVGGYGKL